MIETMPTVVIDNRLRLLVDQCPAELIEELEAAFAHDNPVYHKQRAMGYWAKEGPVIETWRREQDDQGEWWLTLPRGGMPRLKELLHKHGQQPSYVDERSSGTDVGSYTGDYVTPTLFPPFTRALWKHQEQAVQAILERQQGIVRAPTGSGKTMMLLAAIVRAGVSAVIVVHDSKLLQQWQGVVEAELGIPIKLQGIVQGAKRRLRPITLAMQQTLWRLPESDWRAIGRAFGFFAFDEAHLVAARTFLEVADRFESRYRVGVSADETRRDRKEFLNYDVFGPVIHEVRKGDLVQRGIVHEVQVRIVPTGWCSDRYVEAMRNPDARPDFNALLDEMTTADERNAIVRRVLQPLAKAGTATLVFSHRVAHCRVLDAALAADGCATGLMIGGPQYAEEFAETKRGLAAGEVNVGVGTYKAIGTGQDIPRVAGGVAATPIHQNKQFCKQVLGRLSRRGEGKTGAVLYYLWDRDIFGRQAIMAWKRLCEVVQVWDEEQGRWLAADDYVELDRRRDAEAKKRAGRLGGPFITAEQLRGS